MVYCFIWGWVLTTIFSGRIMPDDPFSDVFGNGDNANRLDNEQ